MRVGQLAAAAGVSAQAVRFYERRGVIKASRRLPSGYRDFPPRAVEIVRLVKRLQEVGFTLREAAQFARLVEAHPRRPAETRALAEAKLRILDGEIERLAAMRDELRARLVDCVCCN